MSPGDKRSRILVVVGMTREAKILDGPEALIGGGDVAAALPDAAHGRFAWARRPVATAKDKAETRERTGAVAVDLESFVAGRFARKYAVPFAIVRAVSDAADRTLPHAAQVGLGSDGRPALGAVLASLRDNPWQIGGLVRTALEAEDGFHALERARRALGPRLAGPSAA